MGVKTMVVCPCGNVASGNQAHWYKIEATASNFFKQLFGQNQSYIFITWQQCPECLKKGSC